MVGEKDKMGLDVNLMSEATRQKIVADLAKAELELAESKRQIGDAAGGSHDWHDNFAYEQATRDAQMNMTRVLGLRASLVNVQIINPRVEIETVGIGNNVRVRFSNESVEEEYSLLGPLDAIHHPACVSYKSPLGSKLVGRRLGETVSYMVGDRTITVEIAQILPGKF